MVYVFCYVKSLCSVLRKGFPFLYYARVYVLCYVEVYVLCYVKVYVLCYVEGYVMIIVVQHAHRVTP